ncbi:hypothetical protein L596_008641 [Steinernema carpocapsae]|uniref:Nanos-type domain-containing protein n=1 Tax=Steinernema carpocapsae TaxID=34508 RepID=A0A4U5PD42_STECR|nr:hypothetical protein L596_008641 [Steinernema carpocapsae]
MPLDGPWIDHKPQLPNPPMKRVISPIGTPYRLMEPWEVPTTSGRHPSLAPTFCAPTGVAECSPGGSNFGSPLGSSYGSPMKPWTAHREASRRADVCRFCFKRSAKYCARYNLTAPRLDDPKEEWSHHKMRDAITNVVTCPRLRSVTCEICCATGDNAHIAKLCPKLKDPKFLAANFGRNRNVPH